MVFDTILVGYNASHTLQALELCNRLLRSTDARRRVLVCNRPELADVSASKLARDWEVLQGSNILGEFSGWQEGIDHLGRTGRGILFANDSVTVHRKWTLARNFALSRSLTRAGGKTIVGFRDRVEGAFAVKGLPLDSWIRTNCFAMTADALAAIAYNIFDKDTADECVHGGLDEARFFGQLSHDLEYRLCQHLFHGGWYAAEPLSVQSVGRLTFKARCVVLEKWLAARCLAMNIAFVDPFEAYPFAMNLDKAQTRSLLGSAAGFVRTVRRRLASSG